MGTEIIAITGILGALAVIVLAVVRPWKAGRLAAIYLFWAYQPAHGRPAGPEVTDLSPMKSWEYGIVGVDSCPLCGGPVNSRGACQGQRCGWERPPDRAPWPRLTDEDGAVIQPSGDVTGATDTAAINAALAAGLDRARAIAAEPRPGAVMLPAPTDDISGPGGGPVTPPEPPGWAAYPLPWPEPPEPGPADLGGPRGPIEPGPPLDLGGVYPLRLPPPDTDLEHEGWLYVPGPPPEPELPPSGDWAPGTAPPGADEVSRNPECHDCVHGLHDHPAGPDLAWRPSRLATPADRALAAEVAAALADQNTDAALFIDRLACDRRAYIGQIRRGFLASRGLAY